VARRRRKEAIANFDIIIQEKCELLSFISVKSEAIYTNLPSLFLGGCCKVVRGA
jgi:hypothetical protein